MRLSTRLFAVMVLLLATTGLAAQDPGAPATDPTPTLAISVTMQLIASDPELTSRSISEWADSVDGYFTFRSADQVLIRIPPRYVPNLRQLALELGDTVVGYDPGAIDYREELARHRAAIKSRTESLDQILAYLAESDIAATLSFERELRSLLSEIEYYTGQMRRIDNEVTYASATIYLSSRQRTIPDQRPSTFGWINSVDLYRFLQEARP